MSRPLAQSQSQTPCELAASSSRPSGLNSTLWMGPLGDGPPRIRHASLPRASSQISNLNRLWCLPTRVHRDGTGEDLRLHRCEAKDVRSTVPRASRSNPIPSWPEGRRFD